MTISEGTLKGLVSVCLILVIISFFSFISHFIFKYEIPAFTEQCNNCVAVQIAEDNQSTGFYFVPLGTSVNQLLKSAGIDKKSDNNFKLRAGMRLVINNEPEKNSIIITEISNAEKISIGLPIDINKVKEKDLILIKGIGPATAQKIIALRERLKGFKNIRQLMEIKGIKEKRFRQIQKYLYVRK
ncbi:MAG: helix-hairpin-helix domain-containing protein [Syntrophaceae bacterium]|nr:helix-hairpin-helix domain-containing protein [Syntrophaceae bacterium]